ncbi:cation:proton antiporter, partial [Acinetobacter baumannii]
AGWLLAAVFGIVPNVVAGIIFGFVCTLSSTAVVTKMLLDRSETETLHGRVIVPLLLIQDLMLVPVVALLPALQQSSSGTGM